MACHVDVAVVDHPTASLAAWSHIAREHSGAKLIAIDRLDATPETCDMLILPNMHTPPDTIVHLRTAFGERLLVGPEYVMLDDQAMTLPRVPYADRANGPLVFCAGGSDPDGVLPQMHEWAIGLLPDVRKVFLHGAYCTRPYPVNRRNIFHIPFERDALRTAALVVSTFGQTVYECLYWGTPVLVIGQTDQHCAAAGVLQWQTGGMAYLGDMRTMPWAHVCDWIVKYWHSLPGRHHMHDASVGLLDGRGVGRVADAVMGIL
jgi:spore coat polysaccharide biosynthesis predicted glycosyltransferase SpsG